MIHLIKLKIVKIGLIVFAILTIATTIIYPCYSLFNTHIKAAERKYPYGIKIEDVYKMNINLISDVKGPREKEDVKIKGWPTPPRSLQSGEELLLIDESGLLLYLYFNADGVLFFRDWGLS